MSFEIERKNKIPRISGKTSFGKPKCYFRKIQKGWIYRLSSIQAFAFDCVDWCQGFGALLAHHFFRPLSTYWKRLEPLLKLKAVSPFCMEWWTLSIHILDSKLDIAIYHSLYICVQCDGRVCEIVWNEKIFGNSVLLNFFQET